VPVATRTYVNDGRNLTPDDGAFNR
jgi:hypothetical protein